MLKNGWEQKTGAPAAAIITGKEYNKEQSSFPYSQEYSIKVPQLSGSASDFPQPFGIDKSYPENSNKSSGYFLCLYMVTKKSNIQNVEIYSCRYRLDNSVYESKIITRIFLPKHNKGKTKNNFHHVMITEIKIKPVVTDR